MKRVTTILSLILISSTVFSEQLDTRAMQTVNAVFGLLKCEDQHRQNGIGTCEEEIMAARQARVSDAFIFQLINDRKLTLSNTTPTGGLSQWFWVKTSVELNAQ
jgi:hypothetical protein